MLTIEFRLLTIGGGITYSCPGCYMNILTDEEDPLWFMLYVGQADDVWERIRYHRNHYKTGKSLHYHHWRQPHRRSTFVLLGKLTKGLTKEGQQLMLNIAEQIFATRFQTLPVPTLEEYLPEGKII